MKMLLFSFKCKKKVVFVVKNSPTNVGDKGSIPRSEKSPGGGNDNPL